VRKRPIADPSRVEESLSKFLADNNEMDSIRSVAARQTAWMLVMDGKDQIAAITGAGRGGGRRGERVKIINPFDALGEPDTGWKPLGDRNTCAPRADNRRGVPGRRRKGKERADPDQDEGE
jgi:hypothetical protein